MDKKAEFAKNFYQIVSINILPARKLLDYKAPREAQLDHDTPKLCTTKRIQKPRIATT